MTLVLVCTDLALASVVDSLHVGLIRRNLVSSNSTDRSRSLIHAKPYSRQVTTKQVVGQFDFHRAYATSPRALRNKVLSIFEIVLSSYWRSPINSSIVQA